MNLSDHPDIGPLSEMGRRYLAGELKGNQLQGEFELSRADDIPNLSSLQPQRRDELLTRGREAVAGRVAFGVLAAGASSRMDLKQVPQQVWQLLQAAGRSELPSSKAMVPVCQRTIDGQEQVLTYLDLFLENVARFRRRHQIANPAVMLTSESNGDEIDAHLQQRGDALDVLTFRQPLAPQIGATVEHVEQVRKNFQAADFEQVKRRAAELAGHEILVPKPAGHGEFLHQLVASGMLTELGRRGVEMLSVRNIDNVAAVLDDNWLVLLGYLQQQQLDCLLEVCPRLPGQKGGALIRQQGQWRIAEDPSFLGTQHDATESHYINNAAAIFHLRYLYQLYETSAAELQDASPQRLLQIADGGRRRFPVIVEAKPVTLSDGTIVGAVTPETNMWESTGVAQGVKVGAFGVPSERDTGDDFLDLDQQQRRQPARQVRFSPTKTWDDYADPLKSEILEGIADYLLED